MATAAPPAAPAGFGADLAAMQAEKGLTTPQALVLSNVIQGLGSGLSAVGQAKQQNRLWEQRQSNYDLAQTGGYLGDTGGGVLRYDDYQNLGEKAQEKYRKAGRLVYDPQSQRYFSPQL